MMQDKSFDVKSMIKYAIQSILPKAAGSHDADLVTRLCIMAAVPTGEENPHDLLREMSDGVIATFASNIESVRKNPISAPVANLFFIEWCWRHGHLNEDWKWEWNSSDEGNLSFNPKEPVDSLFQKVKEIKELTTGETTSHVIENTI